MNKRIIYLIIFIALSIIGYFVTISQFPKATGRYPFFIILLLMDIYVWISSKYLLNKLGRYGRAGVGLIYWMPAFLMIASVAAGALYPMTEWPHWISAYLFGIVFVFYLSKFIALVFIFFSDILRILKYAGEWMIKRFKAKPEHDGKITMSRGRFLKSVGLATGGLAMGTFITGMIKWVHDFRVREIRLRFPNLPPSFNGLRLVQISDLHLGSFPSRNIFDDAVELINAQNADYLLFTGDLVNSVTDEAFRFQDSLKAIQYKYGAYAILGNHDYGDYVSWDDPKEKEKNMQDLYDLYHKLGWHLLKNENSIISRGEDHIAILGVHNWSSNPRFPKLGDLNKSLEGIQDVPFKILLSHDPTHWQYEVEKSFPEIDLTLSGHTHGLQMGFEFKNLRWSPAQYIYKYWAGLYSAARDNQQQYLYVNRGLGVIGYQGRVGILPEITVITLESA